MEIIKPGTFDQSICYVPSGRGANLCEKVINFLNISNEEAAQVYCQKYPNVDSEKLKELLNKSSKYYRWGGTDVIPVTDSKGNHEMTVIEVNCCPAGNSFAATGNWTVGHKRVISQSLIPLLQVEKEDGVLAVFYNLPKNYPDIYGYASALADITNESVYLTNLGKSGNPPFVKWDKDGKCWIESHGVWLPVRAGFKRLGLQPWTQVPLAGKTKTVNPMVTCLAGGHNKLTAAKGFQHFNQIYAPFGLKINIPFTWPSVKKEEIPKLANELNNFLVVKVPYSAAAIGIYIITNQEELDAFMQEKHIYEKFVVQALIGHPYWYKNRPGLSVDHQRYHRMGKVSNIAGNFVFDLRIVIACGPKGWKPVYVLGRRAEEPVDPSGPPPFEKGSNSVLLTNMSRTRHDGVMCLDESMALILDEETFENLGIGFEDLVEGYVQSVLAANAVDEMCQRFMLTPTSVDLHAFYELCEDKCLLEEISVATPCVKEFLKNISGQNDEKV